MDTGLNYSTIQGAINAPETKDGHRIRVSSGIYHEHVTVNKTLSLVGEDRSTTIIDGNKTGNVLYVTADNVEIRDFTIQNGTFGLWLENSENSKIIGNTVQDGSYGIRLYHSGNAEVAENSVYRYTEFGVELYSSGHSTLRNNHLAENKYSFGVDGTSFSDFINDIDTSNTVNEKPIHYLINRHSVTIDDSTFQELGYLALINSTNIKVQNLQVQDNIQGILFAFTANSTISNVKAQNNWNGIYVAQSKNITVSGIDANNNFDYGIKFFNSSRSLANRNNVDNNGWAGIGLFRSPNSTVDGNEVNFNFYNLHIVSTNNSVITGNSAKIKSSGYSIAVYYSYNNVIYHNTFVNSLLYVETRNWMPFTPRNSWDNGLEGNYWSNYNGTDANQDGTGDSPYIVGENNIDNHPLMGTFSDFDVTWEGKTYKFTTISNSTISQFQFNPLDRTVSLIVTDANGTEGFCRVAIPNTLLQNLGDSSLTVLINGKQPNLKNKWTDETQTYLYFTYINSTPPPATAIPDLFVALILAFVAALSLSLVILWKKHPTRVKTKEEKLPSKVVRMRLF